MLQVRSPRNLKLALMKSGEGEQQIESAKNIVYRISFLTYKRTAYDRKKVFFLFFFNYNLTTLQSCAVLLCVNEDLPVHNILGTFNLLLICI